MSKKDDDRSTRVDLGDDLIASAKIPASAKKAEVRSSTDLLQDQMESARILAGEGLIEEAKRVLRKVLIADPRFAVARKKLEELQDQELKQLISESEQPRHRFQVRSSEQDDLKPFEGNPRDVEEVLDQDLELGLDLISPRSGETAEDLWFGGTESITGFLNSLDRSLAGGTARDSMDLGIGFLEMGFPKIAAHLFAQSTQDPDCEIGALALFAQAMIDCNRPLEAANRLDGVLRNPELADEVKIELGYWMARAQEQLGRKKSALAWYEAVRHLDPEHRDCLEKIASLTKK